VGRWFGLVRTVPSETPYELARRLGREAPRERTAIDQLTAAYVEGTYARRSPAVDPWPAWLAARRRVIADLAARRIRRWLNRE
ncbi:MAG TPA: DUF4129 domain-containing protein, partial [Chloroflexota bacterium]|nr:DUF4129 domain-containing protein [Chloroflexota bacterium]